MPKEPERPEAYRLLGPPLFPLYDHYLRTSDDTEVLNILYLYTSTRNPAGDASNLLFPFYYWIRKLEPPDRSFFLFPFLFFHRRSEEVSYNFSLPLFYDYRTPKDSYQFLAPLWLRHHDQEASATSHHFLFPFSRWRTEKAGARAPVAGFRFGMWRILEMFEAYQDKDTQRFAALNLFNFKGEAETPFALFHSSSKTLPEEGRESRTHLFPFYWGGRDSNSSYRFFLPFYFQGDSLDEKYLWLVPFFGYSLGSASRDISIAPFLPFTPIALARFGEESDGTVFRNILWPLFHRSYGPQKSSFYSFPFFSYRWEPKQRSWGVLWPLYGNEHYSETGKTAHSILWPLGRFDVEPDGVNGHRRLLPFYYDTFNAQRRHRFGPIFYNYQQRSGLEVNWDFTYAIPDYFGWGSPDDYFGFGFPLYWKSRAGRTGWDLFAPVYYSFSSSASRGYHLLPLFSYNRFPSERQYFLGGPLLIYRRYYDFQGNPEGRAFNLLWPLTAFESRSQNFHYRLLPLFWVSKEGEERDFLLSFLWYRQWGGKRSQNYFFPAFGRYRSDRLERDFYFLGAYFHTREKNEQGKVFRSRHDLLYPLFSFQEDQAIHEIHQRALLAGFWRTRSLPADRTIFGPFYYGHRVDALDQTTHRLSLVLGNFWLAKEVERERLLPPSTPEGKPAPVLEVVSMERGVFWPFLRWGFDLDGRSSEWLLPFYFHRRTPEDETRAAFPLFFNDRSEGRYRSSYFRYFFLFDRELWDGGYRYTLGQLLADWKADQDRGAYRWRLVYPMIEHEWGPEGYSYQLTPLCQGKVREEGGERVSDHFFFPLFFAGATQQKGQGDAYIDESRHFYLFPVYGINIKSLRTQHDFLLPFFHIEHGLDLLKFQLRPFFFFRDDPEELSARLWPFHSTEIGEAAGDWWVSKHLYFSKSAHRQDRWWYRFDPFLFRIASTPDSFGIGGLFELFAYDQEGRSKSFRALPFTYGYIEEKDSGVGVFPLYYGRDFSGRGIDLLTPWRFFFITNHMRGNNYRYTSLLWKLVEHRDNTARPDYGEFRILHALYLDTKSEVSRQWAFNPFFYYSRNDAELTKDISILFALYWYREVAGQGKHRLFWFIPLN
ncbi:MAG: hypothetical protein HY717_11100 [Planctomycetes bacterium]|nr:hypothetical protein [Planctomycetota bacterium]